MSDKPTLVLAPGLLCDAALWRHQIDNLGDLAEIVVADFTTQDTMAAMARAILDRAPGRFSLAALSMGGNVAFEVMRQAAERVERLALLDTSARGNTAEQTAERRKLVALAEHGRFKGVTRRILPVFIHRDRLDDAPLVEAVTAMAGRVGRQAFATQQSALIGRRDSRPDLAGIAVPTLVVCGRQDSLTPLELSMEIAEGIPGARLVVIEDCGHLSTMERPQTVTALLRDWLRD